MDDNPLYVVDIDHGGIIMKATYANSFDMIYGYRLVWVAWPEGSKATQSSVPASACAL